MLRNVVTQVRIYQCQCVNTCWAVAIVATAKNIEVMVNAEKKRDGRISREIKLRVIKA